MPINLISIWFVKDVTLDWKLKPQIIEKQQNEIKYEAIVKQNSSILKFI